MAKTAKKPIAKKTRAKTAGAKAPAKKTSATAAGNGSKRDRTVTLARLYKFNLFAALANLVFAVLSVLLLSKETVEVTFSYATKDVISGPASVLGPAYKSLANVEIRYLLAVIFVISAVFSLLLATKLRKTYEAGVKNSTSGIRWLFTGITLALTLELASLFGGVRDVLSLKLIAALVLATCVLAWMVERENKGSKKHYVTFGLSVFTGVIAWLPLIGSLIGTAVYGIVNFDWYVYTFAAVVLIGFISLGLSQYKHAKNGVSAKGYLQLEGKYLSTEFLIKLFAFLVILLALHK